MRETTVSLITLRGGKAMTKMKFSCDIFFGNPEIPKYEAGKTYDIEEKYVFKWMKRGAVIVEDEPKVVKPAKVEVEAPIHVEEKVEPVMEKVEDQVEKPAARGKNKRK
jgi:hypothetical protein